jgi:hypothetical protein
MGSPVSAVVANLYMEFFEQIAIESSSVKPRVWVRYVDDTFTILKEGEESAFLTHLNSVRPSIKFTYERERNKSRKQDGFLNIRVYRKSTHTDRYLNFNSHHAIYVKRGVVKCLFDRAEKLITSKEDIESEQQHLSNILGYNGYPKTFINNSTVKRDNDMKSKERDNEIFVVIPYTKGLSGDIRRICRSYGVKVVFKSGPTMRDRLVKVKDRLCIEKQSSVVYKIPCSCGKFYIGKTVRRLETRI